MVKGKKGVAKPEYPNLVKDAFFKKMKFNWVGKNVLLHSQDQGNTSTCWTFSTTGAIAAVYAIKRGGKIIPLSKQQLIDCMFEHYPMPDKECDLEKNECFGLSERWAYKFVEEHGLVEEEDYHFIGQRSKCKPCKYSKRYKIDGHKYVKTARRTKKQIQDLIETQPLTCSITAYARLHAHSGEGIYMGPTEKELEEATTKPVGSHALLLVGYGRENGEDFYLVQNSWGAKWGHKGFAKIKRSLITGLSYPILEEEEKNE